MANEINIQAGLIVQRSTIAVQGQGNEFISPTGSRVGQSQVSVSNTTWGSATTLIASGVNAAYLFIKNANTTGTDYLELAYGSGTEIFAKLRAKEFCLVPLKDNTSQIYARTSSAAITMIFVAAEG